MKNIWILTTVFVLLACKGADVNREFLHVAVDGLMSTCNHDACVAQLSEYEGEPYVWDIQFPRDLRDLDPMDEGVIPGTVDERDYQVGRYEVSSLEYDLSRRVGDTDLSFDISAPLSILVVNCNDEVLCAYKDDMVSISFEDRGTSFSVIFSGNRDQALESDSIPSGEMLARMDVGVELYRDDSGAYLTDETPAVEVVEIFH